MGLPIIVDRMTDREVTSEEASHPLQQTFAEIALLHPRLQGQLGSPGGTGWLRPVDFFTAANLTAVRERIESAYRTASSSVVANLILASYSWSLMAVSTACYSHGKRVLDLRPQNLFIHWDQTHHYADRLAVADGCFTLLADDPAAGHPDATPVADQETLRLALLRQLEGHFELALSWLGDYLAVNARAVWPALADRCASFLFWLLNEVAAEPRTPEAIAAEMRALTVRDDSLLANRCIDLITVEDAAGARHCFYRRATCCYAYRRPEGAYCATCPRLSREAQFDNVWAALREKSVVLQG